MSEGNQLSALIGLSIWGATILALGSALVAIALTN